MIKVKKNQIKKIAKTIKNGLNKQLNCSITIRCNDKVKEDAKKVFDDIGIDLSSAINMFLKKSIQFGGIPFIASKDKVLSTGLNEKILTKSGKKSKINKSLSLCKKANLVDEKKEYLSSIDERFLL